MWALDLGTTNSLLGRWDAGTDAPAIVSLPALSRRPEFGPNEPIMAQRAVPSALEVLAEPGLWARMGRSGPLSRWAPGRLAHIGQPALSRNAVRPAAGFVGSYKRDLMESALRTVARVGERSVSAREALHLYLRELFAEADRAAGDRPDTLVVTTPAMCFETYRAEVAAACRALGVRQVRFVDEPVAAALGYGLGLGRPRRVLVVDCGGGTMHVALVALTPGGAAKGEARVLAKAGRKLGGDTVDAWLAEACARRLGYRLFEGGETTGMDVDQRAWERLLVAEARRVKEAVYLSPEASFDLTPPETLRRNDARAHGEAPAFRLTRADLLSTLETRGYLAGLTACVDEVRAQAEAGGLGESAVDDVLMVGGSTLLPGVYPLFEARFGRDRVRAWQPFEAVALGGCVYSAGRVAPADFIVNDYALRTHDRRTQAAEHTVIIPRGTRFPTPPDFWTRALVPTCALGEPETLFKLVVCEVGAGEVERRFTWDADGRLHAVGGGADGSTGAASAPPPVVIELNAANPTLGKLEPPHAPSDTRPRLQVSFGVNADRWLCATVLDLRTQRPLMRDEPVLRLL
jgi:molecular chaperone DnaK (HSP70)